MIRKLSFGQYKFKDSLVHKLDPRIKIIYLIILSVLVFAIKNLFGILFFSLFILLMVALAKLDFKNLTENMRPFYFIFIFILFMYIIFSPAQLKQGFIAVWRFLMLIIISLLLTFTTAISDIVAAIEKLSKPLKTFNIKPRNLAIMISITIRFVPVMFINLEKIKEAMLARLADFKKLKYIKLIMLVLLEKMLKSASSLGDAMQSRLYNEDTENKKMLKFGKCDYLSIVFILILILIIY